jgi:hypothetical protein
MKKLFIATSLLFIVMLLSGCSINSANKALINGNVNNDVGNQIVPEKNQLSINQSVYGRVEVYSGNCMPGPDNTKTSCSIKHDSRKIYFKQLTNSQNKDQARIIKTAESDIQGYYRVELPEGGYSVFVQDGTAQYCNISDGAGNLCPLKISQGEAKELNLRIDHAVW